MSKKRKILLPPSAAGITRYQGDEKHGFHIPPEAIIATGVIAIILEIYLHIM